jgi:hypothetical protein
MRTLTLTATLIALFAIAQPMPAEAGCGCDHPPPLQDVVHPRFGWTGGTITLGDAKFAQTGLWAKVSGQQVRTYPAPLKPNTLRIVLPPSMSIGPAVIEVFNAKGDVVRRFDPSQFTVLPPPFPVADRDGYYYLDDVMGAVDTTGTLLVAFDLTKVRNARQFYINFVGLPLDFKESELVYFNKDQFNLKLFESIVSDPRWYQWGPYYGTDVYTATDLARRSNVISYWRHEFHTYHAAHGSDGSHVVNADGRHPDGTVHVDHNILVAAIAGVVRDPGKPTDMRLAKPMAPGAHKMDIAIRTLGTDGPVAPIGLTPAQRRVFDTMSVLKFKSDTNVIESATSQPANDRW